MCLCKKIGGKEKKNSGCTAVCLHHHWPTTPEYWFNKTRPHKHTLHHGVYFKNKCAEAKSFYGKENVVGKTYQNKCATVQIFGPNPYSDLLI